MSGTCLLYVNEWNAYCSDQLSLNIEYQALHVVEMNLGRRQTPDVRWKDNAFQISVSSVTERQVPDIFANRQILVLICLRSHTCRSVYNLS